MFHLSNEHLSTICFAFDLSLVSCIKHKCFCVPQAECGGMLASHKCMVAYLTCDLGHMGGACIYEGMRIEVGIWHGWIWRWRRPWWWSGLWAGDQLNNISGQFVRPCLVGWPNWFCLPPSGRWIGSFCGPITVTSPFWHVLTTIGQKLGRLWTANRVL